jgi:hypothetical protein
MAETVYFASGGNVLPAGPNAGTSVSSGATANSYGSYVEFSAAIGSDIYIYMITSSILPASSNLLYSQIDIAIGAAASEVVKLVTKIGSGIFDPSAGTSWCNGPVSVPNLYIPSGSRIAVRVADNNAGAKTHVITLHYIPVSSIVNPVLAEVTNPTGSVAADGNNSTTSFKTDLTGTDDYWKDIYLKFTSGALINQVKKITAYNGTTHFVTTGAFTGIPATGVTFELINQ